jgi:hypothetical protein
MLAARSVVPGEAPAEALGVVADPTPRAIAALLVAVSKKSVWAVRALLQGAVRTSEADVAHAPCLLHGVPWGRVGSACLGRRRRGRNFQVFGALAKDAAEVTSAASCFCV